MHVKTHSTQSQFWSLAFQLGLSCENDSAANLFLNCRITAKPKILTHLHFKNGTKIIPTLSIIILVLGYFNYKNSGVPPCCDVSATHLRSRKGHSSNITPVLQYLQSPYTDTVFLLALFLLSIFQQGALNSIGSLFVHF